MKRRKSRKNVNFTLFYTFLCTFDQGFRGLANVTGRWLASHRC